MQDVGRRRGERRPPRLLCRHLAGGALLAFWGNGCGVVAVVLVGVFLQICAQEPDARARQRFSEKRGACAALAVTAFRRPALVTIR